jgi:hypothetical protein
MPFDSLPELDEATLILCTARDLIIEDGWCQGMYSSWAGARCAVGAIRFSIGNLEGKAKVLDKAIKRLASTLPVDYRAQQAFSDAIVNWNDTKGRTKQQVINQFNKAIAQPRKQ